MRGIFQRDLTLAEGPGFRLRRRLGARLFSALLAAAAIGWGTFDLLAGFRLVGAATAALALAFVAQLVRAELDAWRFDGVELRSRRLRLPASQIAGVQVAAEKGRAWAWVETHSGEQFALVEGNERDVRRIANRLSRTLDLMTLEPPAPTLH